MEKHEILVEAEKNMKASVEATRHECQKVRTGRASTALLDGVSVEAYGSHCPVQQVGNITIPEPRTILIQPYDKSVIKAIETAIQKSDLGLNPSNDGNVIRLTLPELNEERRKELVKVAKKICEEGRVSIRNHRHKANDAIKKGEKDGSIPEDEGKHLLDDVQKLTVKENEDIDHVFKDKEKEILEF